MPAACRNAPRPAGPAGPNAFERELLRDPKVIDKLEAKEARRRRGLAGMRRQWASGNLVPVLLAKKLAAANAAAKAAAGAAGEAGELDWMEILGNMEERDKATLKAVAALRKQLVYARFPREAWEEKPKARKARKSGRAAAEGGSDGESEWGSDAE